MLQERNWSCRLQTPAYLYQAFAAETHLASIKSEKPQNRLEGAVGCATKP